MKAPILTRAELNNALTTYHGDHDLACSMLCQSADEIDVAVQVMVLDGETIQVQSLLMGIAQRMRLVAKFADADEEPAHA